MNQIPGMNFGDIEQTDFNNLEQNQSSKHSLNILDQVNLDNQFGMMNDMNMNLDF